MITGNIADPLFQASCPAPVKEMLEKLQGLDLLQQEKGKYPIDEKRFYSILEYESRTNCVFEKHHNYIDIQLILSGRESMAWIPLSAQSRVKTPYNPDKDVCYYEVPEFYNQIACLPGQCCIFFPNDIHGPNMVYHLGTNQPEPVKKAVGKIHIDLL